MEVVGKQLVDLRLPGPGIGLELEYPSRMAPFPSWLGHTPFALWLIGALRPRLIVELGVHAGNSYCAFLQAVNLLGLDTQCFGVDHWRGDEHSGFYDEEVYQELRAYHDPRYGTFSTLLRSSFEEALPYFSERSIDLLHLDGFHTYEAVSADFSAWLPKISSRGVVLFHDISVRGRGFGIWRLWEELASQYPFFEFLHCHGLGILYVGSDPLSGPLGELFAAHATVEGSSIRNYFARLGVSVVDRLASRIADTQNAGMKTQVTPASFEPGEVSLKLETADRSTAKLAALESELSILRSRLEEANSTTEALTRNLAAATLQTQIKTSMIHNRQAVASQLQRELVAANLERFSYKQQLDEILQSRSWRLTEPIRHAVTRFRDLLGLDRGSNHDARSMRES